MNAGVAWWKALRRRELGRKFPSTLEELRLIARDADVPVTHCPPGGYEPTFLPNQRTAVAVDRGERRISFTKRTH